MLRYCTFSWTSTRTSCYATARSLELPYIRHATLCSPGLPRMRFLRFLMKWALRSYLHDDRENERTDNDDDDEEEEEVDDDS